MSASDGSSGARPQRARGWAAEIPREAVLASIEEWRRIGRTAFLKKYDANPALRYVLVHDGEEFDAKAILHGAQAHIGLTPVPAAFEGSREDVALPLRALGFWVEDRESPGGGLGEDPDAYAERARDVLGGTDRAAPAVHRVERDLVRGALGFARGRNPVLTCALCGRELTADLLVAAHIKKRAACNDDERLDVRNIAMIACRLGCDALFEAGYIGVDDAGFVVGSSVGVASELAAILEGIVGRRCSAWRRETAGYFAWHNQNTLRG